MNNAGTYYHQTKHKWLTLQRSVNNNIFCGRILVQRGIYTYESAKAFFRPQLSSSMILFDEDCNSGKTEFSQPAISRKNIGFW